MSFVARLPSYIAGEDHHLLERASVLPTWEAAPGGMIDLATAALYLNLREAHRNTVERIEWLEPSLAGEERFRIVVMPGAFHARHRHTGADGARVFELGRRLQWEVQRVEVRSLGSMQQNALALVEFLARRPGVPTVLVSLSKGGADVRAALRRPAAETELRDVRAWVNISGIISGTPLVAWLKARPLRCLGVRLLLRLQGQRFAEIEELRHGTGSPLGGPWQVPESLRVIHVLGFPTVRHLSDDWARRGHARLAPLGPNDGGGILLADALAWPGTVYPVWGADHYLRPGWDMEELLIRILRHAGSPRPEVPDEAPMRA